MLTLILLLLLRDEQDEQENVQRQEDGGLEDQRLERRQRADEIDVADESLRGGAQRNHGGRIRSGKRGVKMTDLNSTRSKMKTRRGK